MTGLVVVLGATGTIGRAAAAALGTRGWSVRTPGRDALTPERLALSMAGADAVVSCIASRTGVAAEAWAVDHGLNLAALRAAEATGVRRFVLLSAICVQKPKLAFQRAKLGFEAALRESAVEWAIVRPTAYFKSLSGQVGRVLAGKSYLLFGDGRLTATKPISDDDLARFIADCVEAKGAAGRVLPIGGPGPALTPRDQGERLFQIAGRTPRFRSLPPEAFGFVAGALGLLGRISPPIAAKAELARIGRYYATESMLVWDEAAGRYDADATPEYGTETLFDHYARAIRGDAPDDRGAHAVF